MTSMPQTAGKVRTRIPPAAAWSLVAGGALWFTLGNLHPKEDPPDVTLKEHLGIMYQNDAWYPSHAGLLLGIALIALGLIAVVRSGALQGAVHRTAFAAAAATGAATGAMLLHLVMAVEADRIAAGEATPITDAQIVLEALTAPTAGVAIAVLAALGAATRTFGNRFAAAAGIVGGLAYALAGGTFWFTDALNPLFPFSGLIGVWALVTGASLLRQAPRPTTDDQPNREDDQPNRERVTT